MSVGDPPMEPAPEAAKAPSGWRALARIAYRDPEHVAERLVLSGAHSQGEPALEWAHHIRETRPDVPRAVIAEEVRTQTAGSPGSTEPSRGRRS